MRIPSISTYPSVDEAVPHPSPPPADVDEAEEAASVGGAISRMKQSFSETSLGGIASAAIGNLLDVNAVTFHSSTGEIAMTGGGGGEEDDSYSADRRLAVADEAGMGGARGTFLKKLPLPKLSAASA